VLIPDNVTADEQAVMDDFATLNRHALGGAYACHGRRADLGHASGSRFPRHLRYAAVFSIAIGTGVFRFDDGSLLVVNVTGGGLCNDLAAGMEDRHVARRGRVRDVIRTAIGILVNHSQWWKMLGGKISGITGAGRSNSMW
jgi:hypothetical protein